jgi:hypothetical protein
MMDGWFRICKTQAQVVDLATIEAEASFLRAVIYFHIRKSERVGGLCQPFFSQPLTRGRLDWWVPNHIRCSTDNIQTESYHRIARGTVPHGDGGRIVPLVT